MRTETTVLSHLPRLLVERWDHEDYLVSGPVSMDDPAEIHVVLKNKGGARAECWINLDGTVTTGDVDADFRKEEVRL